MQGITIQGLIIMGFPERLVAFRKQRGMNQQDLADASGVSLPQLKRYERGKSEPTLDVIRRIAVALGVSSDALIFDPKDRDPDDDLRLQFEALKQFNEKDREVAKTVIEGLIIRHDAQKWGQREPQRG